jgi:hypothetical protein
VGWGSRLRHIALVPARPERFGPRPRDKSPEPPVARIAFAPRRVFAGRACRSQRSSRPTIKCCGQLAFLIEAVRDEVEVPSHLPRLRLRRRERGGHRGRGRGLGVRGREHCRASAESSRPIWGGRYPGGRVATRLGLLDGIVDRHGALRADDCERSRDRVVLAWHDELECVPVARPLVGVA